VDDERFVLDFLHEHHVLMTHGRGFNYPEPDHFRIVYLPEVPELSVIAERMRAFLSGYSQEGGGRAAFPGSNGGDADLGA